MFVYTRGGHMWPDELFNPARRVFIIISWLSA